MPSAPGNTATPFSIFISYASADRPQARLLGETLTKAGLDVWFDEEELAGGEAWDAKIRQQIRTCTYFMPVVSATTEARREGYFRREWRLAVERTLDLADDVTFLVPVVIDDTPEYQSRVPEKFTTVQWLRCPGGRETPQLLNLARRLAAEHAPAIPPASATPAPAPARPVAPPPVLPRRSKKEEEERRAAADAARYPFPDFPPFPAHGHRGRFVYDLIVWAGHLLRALWMRLPRWLRLLAMVLIVFKAINAIFTVNTATPPEPEDPKPAVARKISKALAKDSGKSGGDALAEKILSATTAVIDSVQSGRPVAIVNFAATEPAVEKPGDEAFSALSTVLTMGDREPRVAVGAVPLPANYTDADALARATVLKCHWLLAGTVEPAGDEDFSLTVRVYDATKGKVAYYARRTGDRHEAADLGRALATDVLAHVSFDEPPAPKP